MIQLSKSGSTITFTFDENSGYLQEGKIDVPVNSLSLVIDESDMATFRKSASNDIFVSAKYEDFGMSKADLETWYKNNMTSAGGGGGGGVTPSEVQEMIDESISGKADTSAVTEAITEATSGKADIGDIPDVSDYFDGAEYDSGTTRINFYHGNTVKAYIDASAFIVDGMIDDVRIETISGVSYLVIDFNTASGKEDIQIPLTDIFDPSNYYDKNAIDGIVSGLNASIDTKLDASAYTPTDLSEYWTSAQTQSAITSATNDMATQTWVNNQGFLTEHQSLSAYSTTEEMNSAIEGATSGKADSTDVQTLSGTVTAHTADTTIHVTSADKTAWNAKSDFSGSYNDLTDKPTIPTVPTNVSDFTNDAGYITDDALSGYAESSAVTEEISAAVSGKQDTLSAGTGISIVDNVISATGGGGSGNPTVELTQAQYDALVESGTVDPTTYYIITDATPVDISNYYTSAQTDSAISAATSGKVDTSSVVTAVTSASTDSEIPTAKAVYDAIPTGGTGGGSYSAGTNIDITNDTISCTLPISTKYNGYSISCMDTFTANTISNYKCFIVGNGNTGGTNGTGCYIFGEKNKTNQSMGGYGSNYSFAFGENNIVYSNYASAFGSNISSHNSYEFGCGRFNKAIYHSNEFGDSGNTLFTVGNGTAANAKHNAFEIRQNGDIYCSDGTNDVKLQDYLQIKAVKVTQAEYDALVSGGTVDNSTLYIITNVVS